MKAVSQYLRNYAEPEARKLSTLLAPPAPQRTFERSLTIPAYRETPAFIDNFLASPLGQGPVLLVLVVNQPRRDTDNTANSQLWQRLSDSGRLLSQCDNLRLLQWPSTAATVLAVDRFSPALRPPDKQGVGLARKIGADIAAAAFDLGVATSPWIHCTDADAHLPADYFAALPSSTTAAAAVYPFRHRCDSDPVGSATRHYERALNYYVAGLTWSGSPYAFHTLGSALAVNAQDYCKARGFPRRAGGEDFYLLNKLAKLGSVCFPECAPITIAARTSDRVPFGTGPAVKQIMALQEQEQPYRYYNPETLVALRRVISAVPDLWQQRTHPEHWLATLPAAARAALAHLDIGRLFAHLGKQSQSADQCSKHFHDWFDAFRTLKFIHYLQQHSYPPLPLEQAIAELEKLADIDLSGGMQ